MNDDFKEKLGFYWRRLQGSGWDEILQRGMEALKEVDEARKKPNPYTIARAVMSTTRALYANDLYLYDALDRRVWKSFFSQSIKEQLLELFEKHVTSTISVTRSGDVKVYMISKPGVKIAWAKDEDTTTDICAHVDCYESSIKWARDLLWKSVNPNRVVLSMSQSKNPSRGRQNGQLSISTDDMIDSVSSSMAIKLSDYLTKCLDAGVGRTMLFHGPAGCHAKGQLIMMCDGSLKKVEDIVVGDVLAGPSGKCRNVLELRRGFDDMVRIVPTKGRAFTVNKDHVLTLVKNNRVYHKHSKSRPKRGDSNHFELIDVTVRDWMKWSDSRKDLHKLVRSGVVNFSTNHEPLKLDPYILGALIGDGAIKNSIRICSADDEILLEFRKFVAANDLRMNEVKLGRGTGKAKTYGISKLSGKSNWLLNYLRVLKLNVVSSDKFIPGIYKTGSIETRRQILAGLIDTDGHLDHNGGFDFCSKSRQLADDVAFVARSLGLAAYVVSCQKRATNSVLKKFETYYRVYISGNLDIIPTRVARKQAAPRRQIKNVRYTGFVVEEVGQDDYYGFTLDADGRYLLDDFTITHNSGKSTITRTICESLKLRSLRIRVEDIANLGNEPVSEMISVFEPDVIIFDDLDRATSQASLFEMLELLHHKVKFVFATVNHINELQEELKRPGRFDEIIPVIKLDESAVRKILGDYVDVFELVKDWPVAFIKEYIVRRKILGAEAALESVKELKKRVKDLMKKYDDETGIPEEGQDDD